MSAVIDFLLPSSLPARTTTRYQRLQEVATRCVSLSRGRRRLTLVCNLDTILRHKICNILRDRLWQNESRVQRSLFEIQLLRRSSSLGQFSHSRGDQHFRDLPRSHWCSRHLRRFCCDVQSLFLGNFHVNPEPLGTRRL